MSIKHKFQSLVTDVGGPTYVQPTHWNAPLNAPEFEIFDLSVILAGTVASMACPSTAGPTGYEFFDNSGVGLQRGVRDFTYVDNIRLFVGLASVANGPIDTGSAALRFQYMASGFPGSWYSFDATGGSGPFVALATANNASLYLASAGGPRVSASVAVSAAVKGLPQPINTRIAAYGGGGSAAAIGQIFVLGS